MDHPPWLRSILEDTGPAPKLFAWSPANVTPKPPGNPATLPPATDATKRIYVLGIGNLGILFATALSQIPNGPPITLVVHRKSLLEHWTASPGLHLSRAGTTSTVRNFDMEFWTDEEPPLGPARHVADGALIHNLIVSTKASAALPQVDRLRRYLGPSSAVAFAQNGMCKLWPPHGEAYNAARYPDGNGPSWLACSVTHGVTSLGTFRAHHASEADLKIGPVLLNTAGGGAQSYLADQLAHAPRLHGSVVSSEELWVLQLEKLVVNCIVNPLTAVLRCKNGALFEETSGPLRVLIDTLIREASGVLCALVRRGSAAAIVEAAADRAALLERFAAPRLTEMVLGVGHRVRENTSSMLQDVRAGKQTEIRDMNGWLVDMSAFLGSGVAVPSHEILVRLVEGGATLDEAGLARAFNLVDGRA